QPTPVEYTKRGAVHLAYQVVGEGPHTLVFQPGYIYSAIDMLWQQPSAAAFFGRLAGFCRLILFDRRGTGASDRPPPGPIEEHVDDLVAVLDAVGCERATLFGSNDGGMFLTLFAATHPARTAGLVLFGVMARTAWAPDYPWGWTKDDYAATIANVDENTGEDA